MTLTTEQRSEINRRNGQKSQGPKTDEGKARSRRNATKHGLRAEVLAMPTEDASVIAARAQAWNEYYQPASPAAQHLVNECVRATIMSDRCHKYHDAALAKHVAESRFRQICEDDIEVEQLVAQLAADPANTVAALRRFGAGCRYLIGRWEHLGRVLVKRGCWAPPERDEAIRLQGAPAETATIKNHEIAWLTRLYCVVALNTTPQEKLIEWMMDAKNHPQGLWSSYSTEVYPTMAEGRESLKELVVEKLTWLRAWLENISKAFENASDASVADRAMILQDEPSAKLFLRYLAESRSTFHRSFKELVKTLDRDQAENATPTVVSPNEPKLVVDAAKTASETASNTVSPNEPNGETATESEEIAQSDKSEAVVNTPAAVSPNEPNSDALVEVDSTEVSGSLSKQRAA